MTKSITCFVNGKWRKYLVIDTGKPHETHKLELSAGTISTGGLEVFRNDPPFSIKKGNAFVGNFPDMQTIMNFIYCLRAGNIKVEDVVEETCLCSSTDGAKTCE